MKKLIIAGALCAFSFSSAAYACDGMKAQHDTQTQAAKGKVKDSKAKKESGSEQTKS
jgi:hypothetical protein